MIKYFYSHTTFRRNETHPSQRNPPKNPTFRWNDLHHPSIISNFIPYLALQTTCRPCCHEKTTLRTHPFLYTPAPGPTPHLVSCFFRHGRRAMPFVQFQNPARLVPWRSGRFLQALLFSQSQSGPQLADQPDTGAVTDAFSSSGSRKGVFQFVHIVIRRRLSIFVSADQS